MLLDLRPGAGNMLGPYWEYDPVWLGSPGTLNTSACPSAVKESSLSRILRDTAPFKYYLTKAACLGILRRAKERGKALPPQLEWALRVQAGLVEPIQRGLRTIRAYAINQRKEGRDLHDRSAALTACTGTEMQTLVTQAAGFLAESSATAGSVGYAEELAPTMKAGGKSGTVLCLNDQGGMRMDCAEEQSGTLRAQTHGHEPLIFENHGIDARYTGPHKVSPTMSARYGTGGNNTPLVAGEVPYCITGNAINREPQNGGNGLGIDEDVAFTLTATDHHAVFIRQGIDNFKEDSVAGTQCARQYKDATDLVVQDWTLEMEKPIYEPYQKTIGALCRGDKTGPGNQYAAVSESECQRRLDSRQIWI